MHCNCSSQVSKQPTIKGHIYVNTFVFYVNYIAFLGTQISENSQDLMQTPHFTLHCFSASLNSLFLMASLALFSAAFTSLLDIL